MSISSPTNTSQPLATALPNIKVDTSSLRRHGIPFSPFGAENVEISFSEIDRCIDDYCEKLKKLSDGSMQLGRVSALLWSIKMLRKQLHDTKCAFLLNAASLNPDIYHSYPDLVPYTKGRSYDSLPACLFELASRCQNFRNRLDGFHEQTDEGVALRAHLNTFIKNVKYRANCIGHYEGRLNTIPIQQYVHQIAQELAFGLCELLPILDSFVTIGVPAIRYEQKRASEKYVNMSTVATLFSGVTASTLQMSVGADATHSMRYVNILWICALVFSVGATLNSLLAMAWRQARTGSRAPTIISGWITSSPGAFLGLAISSFSAGLVLFAYSLTEDLFTAPLTVAATSITFFGLVAAVFGLLYDRWVTSKLYHIEETDIGAPPDDVTSIISNESLSKSEGDWFDDTKPDHEPTPSSPTKGTTNTQRFREIAKKVGIQHLVLNKLHKRQISQRSWMSPPSTKPPAQDRLKAAINKVVAHNSGRTRNARHVSNISIPTRHGLVRYLRFAPDLPRLAITCVREDKFTSSTWTAIFDVTGNPFKTADMWHEGETGLMQAKGLSWSPDGKEVLVRFDRELHIWNYHRFVLRKVRSRRTIRAVTWLDSNTILTAERCKIYKQSRSQRTMDEYDLPQLSIRDIAVETTHNYLVILARVKASDEEALPMEEQKQEKRILVYDMDKKQVVYQLPVLEDVTLLQIPRSGLRMLVSAHQASFQAWEFDANLDSSNLNVIPILRRLSLIFPSDLSDEGYTGVATFGGMNDDYIFSATTGGRIRAWRQRPGRPLELQSSFLLTLGTEQEGDEPQLIGHLAWRPSTATFAVSFDSSAVTSTIQVYTVPGNTKLSGALPVIRTTTSQGSNISAQEDFVDMRPFLVPPLSTPTSRSPPMTSTPVRASFADVVVQAAPLTGHSHGEASNLA